MTDQDHRLETDLHNILKEYPQAPLPPHFRSAVLSRIAATPQQRPAGLLSRAAEQVGTSFLELSSALVMGILLCAVFLLLLVYGPSLPEGDLFPITLSLEWQTLPWGWISAVMVVVVVELVMVILAGLHLSES